MGLRINIFVMSMVFTLFSCNFNNARNCQEFAFMPDVYPYTDTVYANHHNEIPFYKLGQQQQLKLIFYVGGDCSACFAQIAKWQQYVEKNKDLLDDVAKAIVIQTEQIEMLEYNLEKIKNTLPIYIDTARILQTYNNIDNGNTISFLLNQSNFIIGYNIEQLKHKQFVKLLSESKIFINH